MKIALCITTINVPRVLSLYRTHDPDVRFFVALDQNTPEDAVNFCQHDIANTQVVYIQDQEKWKCSPLIGWRNIQRRNLGYLEALRWGADVIVTIDDDNIPLDGTYFNFYPFVDDFDGPMLTSPNGWVDPNVMLVPSHPHRGFPHDVERHVQIQHVTNARVGVAAGMCLGDPDVSAVTRIANAPIVHQASELARAGVVVDPNCHTVFNSQNTAFIRELTPAMFLWPGVGRYDDIFASLVAQRIARERGLYVHLGQPFVWQQRNPHDLLKDLRQEIDGMANVAKLAGFLGAIVLRTGTVTEQLRQIYDTLEAGAFLPGPCVPAARAFLEDCESVL